MSEQESDILARLRAANPVLVDEDRGRGAVAQAALQQILEDPGALAAAEPVGRTAGRVPGGWRHRVRCRCQPYTGLVPGPGSKVPATGGCQRKL